MASTISFSGTNHGAQVAINSGSITNHFHSRTYTIDDIDRLCLRALRCPDALVVKNRLKANKDMLLYRSIEWIFQGAQYSSWKNGEDVCLLWIKGGAGKGKTMMSIGIIERISLPREDSTVVTYFFCQNADYELNTIEAIIKGLILQLVNQRKELKESLRSRWDTEKERFNEDVSSWQSLWNIFLEMLEHCKCSRVYVIVDALDECQDEGMADLLKLIVRTGLSQPSKIKWLLTSRPLGSAEQELLAGSDQVQVGLELNSKHISEAVGTYIAHKVAELDRRHRYGQTLQRKIETELTKKAEGTFLWVSLVCKRLESVGPDKALATIQDLPPGLHSFYQQRLNQLSEGELAVVKGCIRLLKAMMLAYRPLNVGEVNSVTGLSEDEMAIESLVDRCASFIKMRGTDIEFVHQSARDYLAGENGQSILNSHEYYGHAEIALSCLSYLFGRLKVNLVDLPRPDSTWESLKELTDNKRNTLLTSMNYAATFWVQHLTDTGKTTFILDALNEQGKVGTFLRTKLLEWFECLSLLDKLPRAIEGLKALTDIAENNSFVLALAEDATRFLLRYYHTLANWPLQTYSSAIIFSPQTSVVIRYNLDKIPAWLKRVSHVEDTWTSLIQTLAGHSRTVKTVAFSPDGKRIESGSYDNTIKLWDATTGDLLKTLKGHSGTADTMAFSPDGKRIASGSYDNHTIRLWDATTGDLLKTLKGHSSSVNTVAFSPDGKRIASGSDDKTTKLWDATTGDLLKTLEGHSDWVNTVAFSPDGEWLASGSDDKTIKLWDATTGDLLKTLEGHSNTVHTVAFSTDGKRIASGSSDNTTKLWDATNGSLLKTLEGHHACVNIVAFSPDGKRIASGSEDKTLKLWDTTTGDLLKTLEGHSARLNTVAFSPDGKRIASGSEDETIKLWDATTSDLQKTPKGHSSSVNTVAFSTDGKRIASGSKDVTIKLWDATTGDLLKTLDRHSHWVSTVAFSPDGKWLVSGSDDKTIKLWDATTGDLLKTLKGHSSSVNTVAFSPDGKWLASGSEDETIKLWDATISGFQKTLKGHSSSVNTVAFSPDGKRIASGSDDKTIKLWDATTGDLLKTLKGHSSSVNTVAFSPDGKWLASGSEDETIKLWDIVKCLKGSKLLGSTLRSRLRFRSWEEEIEVSRRILSLKFSAGKYLGTNVGPISVESIHRDRQGAGLESPEDLYVGNQWIYYGVMPVLRLPSDFRPTCYDVQGSQVTIGFENGRVLSFDIDRRSLQSVLGSCSG